MGRKRKKKKVLDEEKWRRDPTWYRRCFALRLFYLLVGPAKLKRLPRVLRRLGAEIPPGWTPADPWPPGDYMPPEIMFPPDWTPDDPMPPGVVIPPDVVFPPHWTPDDPMPPGVVIHPDVVFPPGWTPDDPMPPGVTIPPGVAFPPGWTFAAPWPGGLIAWPGYGDDKPPDSPIPPIFIPPWEPGPPHPPVPPPPSGWKVYFDDTRWERENEDCDIVWTDGKWKGKAYQVI